MPAADGVAALRPRVERPPLLSESAGELSLWCVSRLPERLRRRLDCKLWSVKCSHPPPVFPYLHQPSVEIGEEERFFESAQQSHQTRSMRPPESQKVGAG